MQRLPSLLLACVLALPLPCLAESCPQHFFEGQAPIFTNPKLANDTRFLCFTAFAVMDSGITRTPFWSAEYLTADHLNKARSLRRDNAFHPEERLPPEMRSELSDYARSGYDRGHNTPSGDAWTTEAQYETFTLANMVPQSPDNNRGIWEGIESATRALAEQEGELYVITGPLFIGKDLKTIGSDQVFVPTHMFKAIYDPRRHAGAAYITRNEPGKDYQVISLQKMEELAGINLFPDVTNSEKAVAMALPEPQMHYGGENNRRRESSHANPHYGAYHHDAKLAYHLFRRIF
jgi:endonuclease G